MNKNLFRIIFNKRRGQLMAVAETSNSQGKAASGEATHLGCAVHTAALATLSFAVLCALGAVLWALPVPQAHAQVVAYRQAPGNQQPTILQTANGVPQVNIQTPSAAGVSRNVYSQFDVQSNGVILNNSRTSTATQLGGWVQGNPWLARGSARVILNEVNSSNPSYLNGYVEVAGQKAEVVIANPSGISVNGGGFINASKTTLTTGTPILSGGNLDGYRVQGGSITVNGHGLDLSSTDYAAILARAVQVNAGVWANELKVVTGANQIDASSLSSNTKPVTTVIAGTGTVPSFALDVAQIGGMYAGKIHLIGTEQGLGVRSAGTLGSTGGDLVLQNNGWLMNTGTLQAKGDLRISTQGDINNSGTLYASNNQTTDATGAVTNSHQIQAGNTLSLSAGHIDNVVTGEILANTNQLKATHTLTNRGLIDAADTQVDGGTVNNIGTGRIYGDHVSIAATNLTNDAEIIDGVTTAATIAARNRLDLGISNTLTNKEHALIYSGTDMAIGGALDANRQATGQAGTVNNNSATIEASGNLTLSSATLNNRNMHLTTELEVKSVEPVVEYQGSGSPNRYSSGANGVYTFTDESLHLHTPEGNYEAWSSYDVTRTISETTIKTSDPSKILAGGTISLFGDTVYNDNSHIIAGNSLNAKVRALENTQLLGDHVVHDTGTATSYWRNKQKGTDSTGSSSAAYNPADVVTSINLTVTRYLPNTTPAGTGTQMTALNNSSLYKTNPASNAGYLVETDPRFTNQKQWLGSDYITQYLTLAPNVTQKRLGDGFYEQKLIREQVAQLTGRRFLADYTSDEQEYQALMNNAITFAQTYNLRPGIALSAQQVAQLTSDIVWLVEQTVQLPDGSSQKVLVPQVYVKVQPGDLDGSGALLAGKAINLNLSGDLTNSGTIAGRNVVSLTAQNVNNLGGLVQGSEMELAALQDFNNEGGSISAENKLTVNAGRDLNVQTTTRSGANAQSSHTVVDRVAGLYVSGANGALVASAGRDLNIVAGVLANPGSGDSKLEAGNNLNLSTVKTGQSHNIVWDANNRRSDSQSADVGSQVTVGGNLNLKAGQTVSATAADVQAKTALNVQAKNIQLQAGLATQNVDEAHQHTSKGFLSKTTTTTTRETSSSVTALGSSLDGGSVLLNAGNDITLTTTEIHGTSTANSSNPSTALIAGGDLKISSEQISRKTVVGGVTTQSLVTDRSSISGENGLVLYGGKSIDASAVDLNSANGGVSVVSKGDVTLGYNTDTIQKNWTTSSSSRSWYGKKTTTVTQHETIDKTASTTALNGQSIEVLGQNVLSEGAKIGAANAIRVEGVDQTLLYAVQNQSSKTENSQRSSSWFGIGLGSKDQTDTNFKSQSLGTRLESQQAIQIGVGTKADLRGADLQAPVIAFTRASGADTSKTGELILGGSTNTTQSSHTETTKTAGVWQKQAGNGSTEQTLIQTQLKGQTTFDPSLNISVQIPEGNLKTQIQTLSSQPGLAYINDLAKRNDINWNQVSLVHDQWSYSQQGLTPAGAALLTIAVMVATGGVGAELAGTASTATTAGVATTTTTMAGTTLATTVGTTTTFTAAGAAMNAGFSALAAQASVSLANNGGDISKTLKDLGSSSTVKNTLVAMATAGVGTSVAGQGVSAVVAQTAAGCATGAATGAGCEQGAKTAAVLSTAGETYQSLVGYAANAGPGENRNGTKLDGNSTGNGTYEYNPITGQQLPQDRGMNVIGLNDAGSFLSQGGGVSRALNQVPFINATAGLHDYIFNANEGLNFTLWNIPTMLPAAALSIPAALNNSNISWMTQVKQPDLIKAPVVPSVIRIDSSAGVQNAVATGEKK